MRNFLAGPLSALVFGVCLSGAAKGANDYHAANRSGMQEMTAEALRAEIDRQVPDMLSRHDVPSAAIAYISNGEVQWTANYGERAPGEAAGPDTLYNIASVTKAVAAETILQLVETGEFSLDTPMAPIFVDEDLAGDPQAERLTPAMALSHRTGFAQNWRRDMENERLSMSFEPGTRASYSGENFAYLARYARAATGRPLDALARQFIFEPAGLEDMWFSADPSWEGRVAMVRGPDGSLRLPDRQDQPSAADDMHSSIGDFARFILFAMNGEHLSPSLVEARGRIYDDQVEQACPPGIIPEHLCPRHTGFGLGWMIYDSGDNRFLLHNGKDWGERAIALFEPDRNYGVVIFTSGANGRSVISEVLQILVPDERLNALVAAEAQFERQSGGGGN